jgi:hypothetical protein
VKTDWKENLCKKLLQVQISKAKLYLVVPIGNKKLRAFESFVVDETSKFNFQSFCIQLTTIEECHAAFWVSSH